MYRTLSDTGSSSLTGGAGAGAALSPTLSSSAVSVGSTFDSSNRCLRRSGRGSHTLSGTLPLQACPLLRVEINASHDRYG